MAPPPRFATPGPAFGPTVPPFAHHPLTTVVPASMPQPVPVSGPRSRPVSPIPYPGLPMSAPPAPMGPGGPEAHPYTGEPLSDRSSLTAGLLQLFLGAFGAGRLYTGHVAIALLQMTTTWFLFAFTMCAGLGFESPILALFWAGLAWPVVDGIVMLGYGGRDSKGRRLR
jgi:TM2 domain-containing membrane protein YozV